ncbi:UDP-glucose 6-dehydrogenase [Pseudoclavibacter triregionum]|nr:UDP-glucose 6-dehydrogenase [Pseudoclavibacter triregionum]
MRISVIGCGYLGAVHAAGMASLGHDVIGVDVDAAKIAALQAGEVPFHEPGLPELLSEQLAAGRLRFTTDAAEAADARLHFIGVGTPQQEGSNAADLRYVDAAVDGLIPHLADGAVIAGKSTVPVGTARALRERVRAAKPSAELMWNPEFLREGFAVKDTLSPDRLVYGIADDADRDALVAALDECYASLLEAETPRLVVGLETAELVKVAANAFLATKISFINAMAEICETAGGDVTELADAIGMDPRIGRRFLNSGLGFGGGCLPKDIRAFQARAQELGREDSLRFLAEVDEINLRRRDRVVAMAKELLGGELAGRRIALWGLAFKPDSDDIRDSPALDVAERLLAEGAELRGHDPAAMANAERRVPGMTCCASPIEAAEGAELVVLATEWKAFRELDPAQAAAATAEPRIVDARNCLDRDAWTAAGWTVRQPGRPDLRA